MSYSQLKRTPAWAQLTSAERRFLKHNFNLPKHAERVSHILQRAEQKARAAAALNLQH